MDGTYAFVFSGAIGVNLGIFRVEGSRVIGSDLSGGGYSGTVSEDPASGEITAAFDMFIPRGIELIQGASALDVDSTRRVVVKLPRDFGSGDPQQLYVPPGFVWVIVVRVPDDPFAAYAAGMTVSITPKAP